MKNYETLLGLLKKATEPSRHLDVRIFLAVYYDNLNPTQDEIAFGISPGVPKYTASVEAAFELFPSEYSYTFSRHAPSRKPRLRESFQVSVPRVGGFDGYNAALVVARAAIAAHAHKDSK